MQTQERPPAVRAYPCLNFECRAINPRPATEPPIHYCPRCGSSVMQPRPPRQAS